MIVTRNVLRETPHVTYSSHMNTTKTFGSFRQMYIVALRTVAVASVLAITVLVVAQNYILWMPNMYR